MSSPPLVGKKLLSRTHQSMAFCKATRGLGLSSGPRLHVLCDPGTYPVMLIKCLHG